MINSHSTVRIALAVLIFAAIGCAQSPTGPTSTAQVQSGVAPAMTEDGLEAVATRKLDAAYVRPGINFSAYERLLPGTLELGFRTPDSSRKEIALTEAQQAQFRQLLIDAFMAEFSDADTLTLTEQPGPDVLTIDARVQDISAQVLPTGSGPGRAAILLDAVGEATLVLEVRDSQTGEILARGTDTRVTEGAAILQKGDPVTKWSEVGALCKHWAKATRRALLTLTR